MNIPKIIKKTTIITGYNCNNRCRFCVYAHKRSIADRETPDIISEIKKAKKNKADYLVLIGGEPFIRNDIIFIIKEAKKTGFKNIIAATNGRMFAYKDFAKKVIDAGLSELYFSIHGHKAEIHDYLTQVPGSFKELLKGIDNIKALGFSNIGSHTTIVKPNYKYLPQIGRLIYNQGIRCADFVFVDPNYGGAFANFEELVPRLSKVSPYVKNCLAYAKKKQVIHWAVRFIPPCFLKGYEEFVSDTRDLKTVHTKHIALDFKDNHVEKSRKLIWRKKTKKCLTCFFYSSCEGLWKEYLKHFGDNEIKSFEYHGKNN